MDRQPDGYITRHSLKPSKTNPESAGFRGITEAGVELAKERADEIGQLVEKAEAGTIIFQGGVSPEVRTRSTMQVYADTLRERFEGRDDVIIVDRGQLSTSTKEMGFTATAQSVVDKATQQPEAKVVIDLPLRLNEMMNAGWTAKDGKPSKYTEYLLGGGGSLYDMEKRWFAEEGKIDGEQVGPNPTEVAENLLDGFERLKAFVAKFLPDRPIVIGCVGHSFELDALLAYLAGNGKIDVATYEGLQSGIINETEMIRVSFDGDDIVAQYRGNELRKGA